MIKVVLFDFDGVIGDTIEASLKCVNKLADREGYERINLEDIRNRNLKEVLKEDFRFSYFKIRYLRKDFRKCVGEIKVFSGMKDVISTLERDYEVHIVTSNSRDAVSSVLDRNGLGVDSLISGVSLFGKHVVFKKLLREWKLRKSEIVYIGDEIRDVEACKRAGIKMIGVGWGYNSKESLKKAGASLIVNKPAEILMVLRKGI